MKTTVQKENVAVLLDSENVTAKHIDVIMKEAVRFGTLTIKRIYGDWTDQHMNGWKAVLPNYAICPIQQFQNTSGKNSTDSALIIDAMDILYTMPVDIFIIVSSDSDYTRLASKLQEKGKYVVGIGEKKAAVVLQKSYNEFIFIENLEKRNDEIKAEAKKKSESKLEKSTNQGSGSVNYDIDETLLQNLLEAYEAVDSNDEWKSLSKLSNKLKELDPSFSPRNYGCNQLYKVFKLFEGVFELRRGENNFYVHKKDSDIESIEKKKTKKKVDARKKEGTSKTKEKKDK